MTPKSNPNGPGEDRPMIVEEIQDELFRLQDEKYRDFQAKLIPTVDPERVIGVRTPQLRQYARQLAKREDISAFLNNLPMDILRNASFMLLSFPG